VETRLFECKNMTRSRSNLLLSMIASTRKNIWTLFQALQHWEASDCWMIACRFGVLCLYVDKSLRSTKLEINRLRASKYRFKKA
jgi:hypothetical protein